MNLAERKKLFEKACKELSKEDLQLYLFGLIEMIDRIAEACPPIEFPLIVFTQRVLAELEPSDAEATRTISTHIKTHYQKASKAYDCRN